MNENRQTTADVATEFNICLRLITRLVVGDFAVLALSLMISINAC